MVEPGPRFYRWETPFENARFLILSVAHQPVLWFCGADRTGLEDAEPLNAWDELVVKLCDLGTLDLWSISFEQVAAVSFARTGADEAGPEEAGVTGRCRKALGTPLARRHRALTDPVSYLLGTHTQSLEVLTFGHEWEPRIRQAGRAQLSARRRHEREGPGPGNSPDAAHGNPGSAALLQASATPGHVGDDDAIHGGTEVWMQNGVRVLLW